MNTPMNTNAPKNTPDPDTGRQKLRIAIISGVLALVLGLVFWVYLIYVIKAIFRILEESKIL